MDYNAINQSALSCFDTLLHELLPNGKREGNEYKCGSLSGEAGRSLSVNIRTGVWKDFASEAGGSDPISLVAAIRGISMSEAASELCDRLRTGITSHGVTVTRKPDDSEEWMQIAPVPTTAPSPVFRHYKFGEPSRKWEYRDANGGLIGYVCRFDMSDGGKNIIPISYCRNTDGNQSWRWKSFDKPRPLYGLDLLAANPKATVLIVEGEKTCDAARSISPNNVIVVTWPGGGKAVNYTDWTPLAGRHVMIWPDRDHAGIEASKLIAEHMSGNAFIFSIIKPPQGELNGWDLADAVAEGWDQSKLENFLFPIEEQTAIIQQPTIKQNDRIDTLPFRLLGVDGDNFIYVPDSCNQIVSLSASAHTKPNLLRLAPLMAWEAFAPSKSGANWDEIVDTLIQVSQSLPKFDPSQVRGRGCWVDGGDLIYHAGDKLIVNGKTTRIVDYYSSNRSVYESSVRIPTGNDLPASDEESKKLSQLCSMLSWENPMHGELLAGWIALAPICGALNWRPHIWITGGAGSGKSWTITNIVQIALGKSSLNVKSSTSEAFVRQKLGCDALPVVFDEAESDDIQSQQRFEKILELARQASSEDDSVIGKGSGLGKAIEYRIRSMFAFASIGVAAVKKADTSRITILTLRKREGDRTKERFNEIVDFWKSSLMLDGFAEKIRARSLANVLIIQDNIKTFVSAAVEFTNDKRSADQIGTLLAGQYSLHRNDRLSYDQAKAWLGELDWSGCKNDVLDDDENQCLAHLLGALIKVDINGMNKVRSVDECIRECESEANNHDTKEQYRQNLSRHGLKYSDGKLYVANRHQQLEHIFRDTPWSGTKWKQQLGRLKSAHQTGIVRFGENIIQRSVCIDF